MVLLYLVISYILEKTIKIEYPESLANSLKLNGEEFAYEMKLSSLVKLYELGKITSGVASNILKISRLDFLELLSDYKVSVFDKYDNGDLEEDISNA